MTHGLTLNVRTYPVSPTLSLYSARLLVFTRSAFYPSAADDLYELIGFVSDDEAQYVCRKCSGGGSNQPLVNGRPEWLLALESLRTKGFSIICASLLDKKYSQSIASIDEPELKAFYDKYQHRTSVFQSLLHNIY